MEPLNPNEIKQLKAIAADNAIEVLGGPTKASQKISALTGKNVSRFRVRHWKKEGIQAKFCPAVHQLTGIPLTQLDPEIYPVYLFAS